MAKYIKLIIAVSYATILFTFGCAKMAKNEPVSQTQAQNSKVIWTEETYYREAKASSTPDSMAVYVAELKSERPTSKYLAELYYDLGERFKKEEQYADAVAAYRQVVTYSDPRYQPDAYLAIAECYYKLWNWTNAAKEYQEFIRRFPKHQAVPGALYYGGASYFNFGKNLLYDNNPAWRHYIQKSLDLFDKALRNFPKNEFRERTEILRKEAAFVFDQPGFAKSFEPGYRGPAFGRRILKDTIPYFEHDAAPGIKKAKFVLHFDVTPQGTVHNVVVKKSSGVPEWDQSCRKALSEFLFAPLPPEAIQKDQWGEIEFSFSRGE